ncbi:MAG: polysaccharide deacetylase family protein [Erysipelotrichaceae bacterium]|nr:polysaccharide deacetylase family protein [Erysipelotrichaceae bacterium]
MKNIDDKKDISKKIKTKREVEQKEKIVPKKKNNNKNVKKDILKEKTSSKRSEKINKIKEEKTNKKEILKKNKKIEEIEILENLDKNNKDIKKIENTKKTKNKEKEKITNNKKILLSLIIIISLIFITLTTYNIITFIKYKSIVINNYHETKIDYLAYYKENIITLNKKILYKLEDDKLIKAGVININNYLSLEKDDFSKDGYFKIKNTSYYIDYKDIKEEKIKEEKSTYLNYITFNESVKVNNPLFYLDDKVRFSLLGEFDYPVLVKEKSYYGVLVNNKLYYLKKEDCSLYKNKNTNLKTTSGVPVLVYHFTYDSSNLEEKKKCLKANSTICLSDEVFSKQLKYLKDNDFYTATLNDLEMFIDGKIRLPEHTVVITIDDGYFVSAAIKVLEKYDMHGTLFLIGQGNDPINYKSNNLEIHSHTYAMHYPGACPGGQGSPLKCLAKDKILADLKKSRESLNNSPYFCYPFFEYNDYAISLLKEAGFRMAFAGHRMKVRVGANKYKLPRYGIINTTSIEEFSQIVS